MKINIKLIIHILLILLLFLITGCSGVTNAQTESNTSSNTSKESATIDSASQSLSETSDTNEEFKEIPVDEAYKLYNSGEGYIFIDVRSEEAYAESHVKGALGIPVTEIRSSINEIPRDKVIIIYCSGSGCGTSKMAAKALAENGFTQLYIMGGLGILEWANKGYPVE